MQRSQRGLKSSHRDRKEYLKTLKIELQRT